jgi:hypothetical protein
VTDSAPNPRLLELVLADSPNREPVGLPVQGLLLIGSSREAQLRLPGLEGRHAAIAPVKGGGYGIKALSETGSLEVNGQALRAARLNPGDRLRLGNSEFLVRAATRHAAAGEAHTTPHNQPAGSPAALQAGLPTAPAASASATTGQPSTENPRSENAKAETLPSVPGYRLIKLLGRGALAKVYLAQQEKLERPVALKLLAPRWAQDQAFVARFQAEARAAAALHHAQVVTVFDVGHAGGWHYLALEYMDRGSLEDRLAAEGPLPWRAVLGILRDAALGLEFARSKGLLHRDIKPANLMQNAAGNTKIADLGLAASEAEAAAESGLEGRRIVGTPHFMAPEQARGEAVDHRADLYALGASAYRLLCGANPYDGSDPRDILRAKLSGPHRPLAERQPELPDGVVALVESLLARDPAQRPENGAVVVQATHDLMQREGRRSSAPRRVPLVRLGVAGVFLLASGYVAWQRLKPQGAPVQPPKPAIAAGQNAGQSPTPSGDAVASTDGRALPGVSATGESSAATDGPDLNGAGSGPGAEGQSTPEALLVAGGEEDRSLKELEQRAAESLARALATPDSEARRLALAELTRSFAGTDAAQQGQALLQELDLAAAPQPAATPDLSDSGWAGWLEAYRRFGADQPPAQEWAAKASYTIPAGIDPGAWAERIGPVLAQREREVVALAAERGAAALAEVRAARFAEAERLLLELIAWSESQAANAQSPSGPKGEGSPTPPAGGSIRQGDSNSGPGQAPQVPAESPEASPAPSAEVPPRPAALPALEPALQRARELLSNLPAYQQTHLEARLCGDRRALAQALAGPDWLHELDRLEFTAALARLKRAKPFAGDQFEASLAAPLAALIELLQLAAPAPGLLSGTLDQGLWRRKTIRLPGDRRGGGEVIALRGGELVLLVNGGEERFALAEYVDGPDLLTELFEARLSRDWTSAERQHIAAWLYLQALLRAGELLRTGLAPEMPAKQLPVELLEQAFDQSEAAWGGALSPGARALLAADRRALQGAATAINAAQAGDWTLCAYALESLFSTAAEGPLLWLLSEGSRGQDMPTWPPADLEQFP